MESCRLFLNAYVSIVSAAPNSTRIEGYTSGSPVREGEMLKLICRSRGGNPPPNLVWLKDGIFLPGEIMTQRIRGNHSHSHSFRYRRRRRRRVVRDDDDDCVRRLVSFSLEFHHRRAAAANGVVYSQRKIESDKISEGFRRFIIVCVPNPLSLSIALSCSRCTCFHRSESSLLVGTRALVFFSLMVPGNRQRKNSSPAIVSREPSIGEYSGLGDTSHRSRRRGAVQARYRDRYDQPEC